MWTPASRSLGLLALLAGCVPPPEEAGPDSALPAAISRLAEDALRSHPAPGISIGVRRADQLLFARGFGYADLEHGVPATEHTVYRIGSVTKQFTAAAAMLLVEDGALDLAADLREYLPEYDTGGFTVPVERLLNHTSGIKGYTEIEEFWKTSRLDLGHEAMMEMFSSEPFEFEPGDRYQYSNSGYYLLGVLIERLSGLSYREFLVQRLFAPLGLERTHYLDYAPIVAGRAAGYETQEGGGFRNDDPLSMRGPYAAGALGASVLDLLAWQRALASGGLVSESSYQGMTSAGSLVNGEPVRYGYGLSLGEEHGLRKVSHGGGINGFRAQLSFYPEAALGIAVLINAGSGRPALLENRIAREVLGMDQPEVEEIAVAAAELRACTGTYDAGRAPVSIRFEDGALFGFGRRLVPVDARRFHPEDDPFIEVRCDRGAEGGNASALVVTAAGVETRFWRVPDGPPVEKAPRAAPSGRWRVRFGRSPTRGALPTGRRSESPPRSAPPSLAGRGSLPAPLAGVASRRVTAPGTFSTNCQA